MPAYLIRHEPERPGAPRRGDLAIEDPHLTLTFANGWAVFHDRQGPTLAIPTEPGLSIQRIDNPDTGNTHNDGPAPGR